MRNVPAKLQGISLAPRAESPYASGGQASLHGDIAELRHELQRGFDGLRADLRAAALAMLTGMIRVAR